MTAESLPAELRGEIARLARTPRLLVACDYDGTLAPIVADPEQAHPRPESVDALRSIAGLPETTTAVISGRALRDLARLAGLPSAVHLVGSHGAEFDAGFGSALDASARELHQRLADELRRLTEGRAGVHLEVKPASIAVHVRRAETVVGQEVLDAVKAGPGRWDGVERTDGKAVVELAVVRTDKGHALDVLRHQADATAAVFIGDDVTDEKAFARLSGPDLGIKVGAGPTLAGHRIDSTAEVAAVLALLLAERRGRPHS